MSKITFFDPDNRHPSLSADPDLLHLLNLNPFLDSVSADNHTEQILCICCDDPSAIINDPKTAQQNLLIYICEHCHGRESNPTYRRNVSHDFIFDPDAEWKAQVILDRLELAGTNGNTDSALADAVTLLDIENRPQKAEQAEDEMGDISSDASGDESVSKESLEVS